MNQSGNQLYTYNDEQIQDVFLSLLEKKDVSQISIREICEQAQINRSTFYRHYDDIYALMQQIEENIFSEFLSGLQAHTQSDNHLTQMHITAILHHIQKYATFYSAFLSSGMQDFIFDKHPELWAPYLTSMSLQYNVTNERHMHYYFSFFKAGFIYCITKWLEEGCPESPEELSYIIWKYSMH